ncbi:MAG: outer membrane beta-barrel protein [Bacteroidales bacterium]|nr:outer membrane beta-barrel protein [Bacteroidales bacterium]MCF8388038.1 outer membrane beta-barrel protein [Bacteroidales bacterium]MCF8398109.1 outer membrane beta-barrel protein [Bacteroidales bacterium]
MKKLVTLMIAIALVVGFSSESKAQLNMGVTAGIALPMGDWSDGYNMGFGGMLEGDYFLQDNIALGVNIGYYAFSGETVGNFDMPNMSMIPILVKGDYYFQSEGFMPYGGASLGIYIANSEDLEYTYIDPWSGQEVTQVVETESDSEFGFSPHVGFLTGDNIKFGAEVAYTIISDANHLNASVRVLIPLGN